MPRTPVYQDEYHRQLREQVRKSRNKKLGRVANEHQTRLTEWFSASGSSDSKSN